MQPGESYIRDQETFNAENAARLVVVAAVGHPCSYAPTQPSFCYCVARIGGHGKTNADNGTERAFLIPTEEYDQRRHFGFVITDPSRYQEVPVRL